MRDGVLLLVLAYCVGEILIVITQVPRPEVDLSPITLHVLGIVQTVGGYFAISAMVYGFGRAFGGEANFEQCVIALAWHALATTPLAPLVSWGASEFTAFTMAIEAQETPPPLNNGAVALTLLSFGAWFWLLASYIAEVHRFQSIMVVMAIMVGVVLMLTFLMAGLTGAG